jgi:hypothetical protein
MAEGIPFAIEVVVQDGSGTNDNAGEGKACRWCGKPLVSPTAWLCAECKKPAKAPGYMAAAAAALLLPLFLALATFWLSSTQQQTALDIANRQKLADAYVAFGATMTELRRADATIQMFATRSSTEAISYDELRKAVLNYDAAFNAIGAKLGPFEEEARRIHDQSSAWPWFTNPLRWFSDSGPSRPASQISLTWNRCFVAPYYGTSAVPTEKTYWFKVVQALNSCSGASCQRSVAVQIADILEDVFSGSCVCEKPEIERPLTWFYPEIQSIMEGGTTLPDVKVPGTALLRPPNKDVAKTSPFCAKP